MEFPNITLKQCGIPNYGKAMVYFKLISYLPYNKIEFIAISF
jgi:hypothetical protein